MTPSPETDRMAGLVQTFQRGPRAERWQALCALEELGPEAAPAAPELITALSDADLGFRTHAVLALVGIGESAVFPLLDRLATADEDLRKAIIVTLGRLGPAATAALPVLIGLLEEPGLTTVVQQALDRIQRSSAVELVPHFRQTFRLALLSSAGVALLVGGCVLLVWSGDRLQPDGRVPAAVAVALGVFGGGLGATLGAHSWGRGGAAVGLVCFGTAGYVVGLVTGEFAARLLAPLLRVLEQS